MGVRAAVDMDATAAHTAQKGDVQDGQGDEAGLTGGGEGVGDVGDDGCPWVNTPSGSKFVGPYGTLACTLA